MPRLTWRREQRERGLARVAQGERGYDLRYGGQTVGRVRVRYQGFGRDKEGYYWTAGHDELGIPRANTSFTPCATVDEAKTECAAYVKRHLKEVTTSER